MNPCPFAKDGPGEELSTYFFQWVAQTLRVSDSAVLDLQTGEKPQSL